MHRTSIFIWFSLVVLIASSCSNGPERVLEDNDWTISGLNGKIKSVTERSYQAQDRGNDEWTKGPAGQTYSIKKFNNEGFNESENSYFWNDNSLYSSTTYEYDADNNLTKINRIASDGSSVGYTEIINRIGKVRPSNFEDYFVSPEETVKTGAAEMTWDNFQLKETKFYDKDGQMITRSTTTYDDKGHILEYRTERLLENSSVTLKYSYLTYDDEGNWTSALKELVGFNYREITERVYEYYPEGN